MAVLDRYFATGLVANKCSLLTLPLPLYRAASQDDMCMVTEVSTLLIITQVGGSLKKGICLDFASISCLAIVKSCVSIGPICGWQIIHIINFCGLVLSSSS